MIFTSLTSLNISRRDFVGLESLKHFSAENNLLKSLPDNLFMKMQKLDFISFNHNRLEFLSSNLLKPIEDNNLGYVGFRSDTKIDEYFQHDSKTFHISAFDSLKKLIDFIDRTFGLNDKPKNVVRPKGPTNFTINVQQNQKSQMIQVHKHVLAASSPVFEAMFRNNSKENILSEVEIFEFSVEAFIDFVNFIYFMADKYDVCELKEIMETIILENIDESNAHEILNLGLLHNSKDLKEMAFDQIKATSGKMKITDKFLERSECLLELIRIRRSRKRKYDEDVRNSN